MEEEKRRNAKPLFGDPGLAPFLTRSDQRCGVKRFYYATALRTTPKTLAQPLSGRAQLGV
jgi:hypothetical protein